MGKVMTQAIAQVMAYAMTDGIGASNGQAKPLCIYLLPLSHLGSHVRQGKALTR